MDSHRDDSRAQPAARVGGGARAARDDFSRLVVIPGHRLLRCIGRGSYGEVWLASAGSGVYRAVKILHRHNFKHDRPFERELSGIRRFEPMARSHEGLIHVLQIGVNEAEGRFYYIMELGDDESSGQNFDPQKYSSKTLAKEIALQGKLPLKQCLQLGLELSLALVGLHKRGLVHRDVKPSNIIFVKGRPKLADIGLVAEVDKSPSYVGTAGFIPPEGPGTAQADVYGLGKVLYEASTGKDRQQYPELPADLDQQADYDLFLELNEIIVRACSNQVGERYQSAWDMYVDFLLLANGESLKRLNTRQKRLAGLKQLGAISGLVLLALGIALHGIDREESPGKIHPIQTAGCTLFALRPNAASESLVSLRSLSEDFVPDQFDANPDLEGAVSCRWLGCPFCGRVTVHLQGTD